MTDRQHIGLVALNLVFAVVTFICLCIHAGSVARNQRTDHAILTSLNLDNQTIFTLRAEVTQLKTDLHEVEVALDKEAIENLRLRDALHLAEVKAELRQKAHTL